VGGKRFLRASRFDLRYARVAAEVIAHGEPERLAAKFPGGGRVESFRHRIGIHALRECRGFAHSSAAGALRVGGDVTIETRDPRYDDGAFLAVAVGLEDDVAQAAANRGDEETLARVLIGRQQGRGPTRAAARGGGGKTGSPRRHPSFIPGWERHDDYLRAA
jgi:hypothetical protein